MPGAVPDPLGIAVFGAIKLAGYSFFSIYLNHLFPERKRNFVFVGAVRTVIGFVFGTVVGFAGLIAFLSTGTPGLIAYVLALIPLRFLEWLIIVRGLYGVSRDDPNWLRSLVSGIICSFLLDVPALVGFFSTGGFWIC